MWKWTTTKKKKPSEHHLTFHHHPQARTHPGFLFTHAHFSSWLFIFRLSSTQAQWVLVMGGRWCAGKFLIKKGSKQSDNQGKHKWAQLAGLGADETEKLTDTCHHLKAWKAFFFVCFRSPVSLPHSMAQWWEDQWEKMRRDERERERCARRHNN